MDLSELKGSGVKHHVQQEIRDVLRDVCDRYDLEIADRLKTILLKYYAQLSDHKFDFGVYQGLEYEIPMTADWDGKPIHRRPYSGQSPADPFPDRNAAWQ